VFKAIIGLGDRVGTEGVGFTDIGTGFKVKLRGLQRRVERRAHSDQNSE
jgi:hypothetical protein